MFPDYLSVSYDYASKEGLRISLVIIVLELLGAEIFRCKSFFSPRKKNWEDFLCVRPPKETKTNYKYRFLKTVYGLVHASKNCYVTLKPELEKMQTKSSLLDQGLLALYVDGYLIGIMLSFVDDVL